MPFTQRQPVPKAIFFRRAHSLAIVYESRSPEWHACVHSRPCQDTHWGTEKTSALLVYLPKIKQECKLYGHLLYGLTYVI